MASYANPSWKIRNNALENRHACFMVLADHSFINLDSLCEIDGIDGSANVNSNLSSLPDSDSSSSRTSSSTKYSSGNVRVRSYFRSNGTYVKSYTRSSPSSSRVSGFGTGRSSSSS